MRINVYYCAIALVIGTSACGNTKQPNRQTSPIEVSEQGLLIKDQYEIRYDDSWKLNENGINGTEFFLLTEQRDSSDMFTENINLMIQDLSSLDIGLDEFVARTVQQVSQLATNSEMLLNERHKNVNGEFQKLIYTADQGIFKLQFEQHLYTGPNLAYILTFTAEQDMFAEYSDSAGRVMSNFTIKQR